MMTGFNISQESTIVENNQRQEQQYEEGKAAGHNFTASQHFSHRIAELQRQTTEVQKLPEFYNERVMSLRKRTLELQEAAGTYTSGEGEQPQYQLTSSAVSGCKDQNQEWRQENQAYVIRCEDQERRVSFHNQDENAKSPQYINTIEVENKLARMHGNECDSTMVRHLDVSQNCYLRQEGERQNLSPNENVVSMNYTAAHSRLQSIGQGGEHSYRPEQSYQNHTNEKDQYMTQTEDYVDTNQLNSTTRNQELQRAQIKNHQDLLGGGRPHHIQVLSQEITMAHNKRDHDEHLDRNSFELTKKLDAQAYSHGTYRGPHTVYTMTTEKAEENPNINDERKNRNKERRRQKREHKLQKLKELHDQAQYSMTQIASGLSSQAASVYQSSHRDMTDEGHGNIAALSPMSGLINLNAQQEVEETSRVKSTVQKLANTRKEIKKLIKIQNKHSKLLRQLQKSGVVKPTESQDGLHQESQASNLTMSEMSVNQKQFQMAQSTNLLRQMQDIFKYLAQIQEKLDFEIEERKMRTGQLLGNTNQTSSAMPLQMPATQSNLGQNNSCYEDDSLQQQQQQHPQHLHTQQNSQNQQFFGQFQQPGINSQQQSLQHGIVTSNQKNNSLSQGTTSTLFWDTQMAYNNNAMFGTAGLNNVNAIANPNPPILISQNQQQQQQLSDFHKNEMATSGRLQSLIHIQPLTQENSDVRTTQSDRDSFKGQKDQKGFSTAGFNNRNSIQQQTASLTQKTESDELNSSILLGGNASSQQNLHQLTNKVTDRTLTVTSDQLQKSSQMPAKLPPQYNNCASSETTAILSQTANTNMSLNGIRVDQLCEILSREIGRVREESVQQAHDMRYQYEVELQQLRQEFHQSSSTNNLHNGVTIGKDSNKIIMDQSQFQQQHHLQQNSSNKDLVQQRQMELFNCDGSSNIDQTQRTDPGSQQLTTQRQPQHYQHQQYPMMTMPTNDQSQTHFQQMLMQPPQINSHQNIQMLLQEQQNNQNMVMNDEEQEEVVEEPHQMPHTVFEELEKVKAERDAYYEKLMRVRNRISQAKGLANNGIVNSSTERTENSPAMSGQMPMQMQLQMQVQGFIDTNDMSAYENVEADQPARPNQASNYIQTTTNEGTGTFVDTTKGTQELRQQLQNYNTDFNIYPQHHLPQQHDFSDLAKKQQLNNQQTYHSLESNIPSHFAISQQQKHLKGEQQRSATQDISIIDTQQNYPVNMTSTSQTVKQESLEGLNGGNGQQNNRNAGKIVHQFRTFQLDNTISTNNNQQQRDNSVGTGSRTSKTRNGNEIEKCRKPGKYLNVRHNRTSLLRQNKVARERGTNIDTTSIGPKCSSCLMSSSEVGAGGSQERSFKSNRSSTSQTRKVGGNMHNIGAMSTLGGGRESSNECTMCHGKLGASKMTTPFINESVGGVDPNILMMVNSGQSSASNRKVMALQQRRSRTPNNDNLTFSNNANSTFSSQGLTMEKHQESHALPSRAIGGRHTIQTMIPRSPDLIGRLAAEHEQLYVNASAQESLEQMQQNQQTGGSINEQHSESRALQVIQHYLEKYDKH